MQGHIQREEGGGLTGCPQIEFKKNKFCSHDDKKLQKFPVVHRYNLQELLLCIKKCAPTDILRCLKDVVRSNRAEKWRKNIWLLLHDNAPAHWPALFKYFLAKNNVTTLKLFPYSSNVASADMSVLSTEINIEGKELL